MLGTERLRTLLAVARTGSFAAAAGDLYLTPSAVSQQMAALEREAAAVLFERNRRGVRLTDAGRALVAHAEVVVARLADARAELEAIGAGGAGRLRFGSFPTATATFVARAVAAFGARHPGVELRFFDGEPYESAARLKARELDLAVVFDLSCWPVTVDYDGQPVCAEGDLDCVELFADPFAVLVPAGHPLEACAEVAVEQLAGERVVGSPRRCAPWGADLERLCRLAGFEPVFEDRYRSADFQAQQAFVAAGRGLTLLPRLARGAVRDDVVVRPLVDGPVRHVKLATPAGAYRSPAVAAMVDVLCEAAGALGRGPDGATPR